MVVCKYFLKGHCKFGNKCYYDHVKPNQQGYSSERNISRNNKFGGNENSTYNPNYIQPGRFQNQHQNEKFSSPFSRNYHSEEQHFQSHRNDRYHWTPTSNQFAPLHKRNNDNFGDIHNSDDQLLIKSIQDDINLWSASHMWPFSCFSPGKSTRCLEGLPDIQPEELRLLFYFLGPDAYRPLVNEVNSIYSSRKSELLRMSEETRMSVLACIHSNVDDNPSSQLTIISLYGSAMNFKGDFLESLQLHTKPEPIETEASITVTKQDELLPKSSNKPSSALLSSSIQSHSLFKSQTLNKLATSFSKTDEYTDESLLSEAELQEFKAARFTLGKIPMRPPPKGLCR